MIQDIRYSKNLGSFINKDIQNLLLTKTICVLGCGGNGGYILEFLIRLGVKKLIFFDGDLFEESNINRQIYYNLNKNKAEETYNHLKNINPEVELNFFNQFFTFNDIDKIKDCDIIINCADNLDEFTLLTLRDTKIPFLFQTNNPVGAVNVIIDADHNYIFDSIIKDKRQMPQTSQPAFLCAFTAAIACSELIKFFADQNYQCGQWKINNLF